MSYHHHHHHLNTPPVIVHDHDVLSGRGVNISGHPGNQRYRTLILTRKDGDYCEKYTTSEKRAVAEEIIKHIHSLDPPGRFLKREVGGRGAEVSAALGWSLTTISASRRFVRLSETATEAIGRGMPMA